MCLSAALSLIVLQLCVYGSEASTRFLGAGVEIGQLPTLQHGVRGTLYALDETTFFIEDFEYDGQGPATYVYVFRRGQPVLATGGGIVIDWSGTGDGRITSRYTGSDVTISLTNQAGGDTGLTVEDIGTFTIWCEFASVFFTRIEIPSGLMLGPGSLTTDYCAELTENFQVSWAANDTTNTGVFELCGCIEENQYLAFGISGSNTRTDMIGADVIVVWVSNGQPNAVDYLLTARQKCRSGSGVCPDTMVAGGSGTNDVSNVTGRVTNGLTCVKYLRMLNTGDSAHDLTILANQSQFIAWAIGPRATEAGLGNLAFFHTEYPHNRANVEINFGEDPTGDMVCQVPPQCTEEDLCGWTGMTIIAREARTFRVRIGPSGGLRGYEYITGLSGWGIAFYIDGMLAPLLKLRRNVTYTFIVEAGDDPNDAPNYYPFYITNSQDGGILLNQGMQNNEVVYAGYNAANNNATAAGRHCQYVETSASASVATSCDSTLQQYINTLNLSCQGNDDEAAVLVWTPDENIPNTVYYQCANHLHLGWKIELDSAPTDSTPTPTPILGEDSCNGVENTSPFKLLMMIPVVFTIMDYVL